MKQTKLALLLLVAASMLAVGCIQTETGSQELKTKEPDTGDIYFLRPRGIYTGPKMNPGPKTTIGKKGGDIIITASYPDSLGNIGTAFINEYFTEGNNLGADFVKFKGRKQINGRTVEYTFFFEENNTGSPRYAISRIVDSSFHWRGARGAINYLYITQEAE